MNAGRKSFKPRLTACRDDDGSLLTEKEQILRRRSRYFNELLNGERVENNEVDGIAMMRDEEDELEPPDEDEIADALTYGRKTSQIVRMYEILRNN